jgi:hypothetical protein
MSSVLSKENIKNIYTLSPMQEGMFFEYMIDPKSKAYIQQVSFDITGKFENKKFKTAIEVLVSRHDILRTVFSDKNVDKLLQVVLKKIHPEYQYLDLSQHANAQDELEEITLSDRVRPFNLKQGPVIRTMVLKSGNVHRVLVTFHHIILDGWSLFKILNELFLLYQYDGVMESEPIQFGEYIKWIKSKDEAISNSYWSDYLKGFGRPSTIPVVRSNDNLNYDHCTEDIVLDKDFSKQILAYTRNTKVTGFNLFLTSWAFLLATFNGLIDVCFGAVVSGRGDQFDGLQDIIGITINTIPIRIRFNPNDSFVNVLKIVQMEFLDSDEHSHESLSKIQARSKTKHTLFDHIFVYENIEWEDLSKPFSNESDLKIDNLQNIEHTNYNFEVVVYPRDEMLVRFSYNCNAVNKSFVKVLAKEFKSILTRIITNPTILIKDILLQKDVLSTSEIAPIEDF